MAEDSHRLELDLLTLSTAEDADTWHEDAGGYSIRTLATDADFGHPAPITSVLPSALAVGSRERITGWGNRDITFQIELQAPSAMGLARAEKVLKLAVRRARELRWTPPADAGAVTVHDVHHARIENKFDDLDETGKTGVPTRVFWLRVTAMPFPRSAAEVVEAAVGGGTDTSPSTPVVTTIYNGTGTGNWSAVDGPPVTTKAVVAASGGGVRNADPFTGALPSLRYSASIAMGTDRWLVIRRESDRADNIVPIIATWGGTPKTLSPTSVIGADHYYRLPATGLTITNLNLVSNPNRFITVRSVSRQNMMPFASNTRQLIRQIDVKGTAVTEGSLALSHATSPLGQVMVYSWPEDGSGYVPPISQYMTSGVGDAITDPAAVLGRYLPVTSTSTTHRTYEVPAAYLPEGTYSVLIRAKVAAAAGVFVAVSAATRLGGVSLSTQTESQFLDWTTTYRVQAVCNLTLPPAAVPRGSAAKVRITVGHLQSGVELRLDEVYLCNVETGELTLLDAGSGTVAAGQSSNRLWIDSPTVDRPQQAIWVGTLADRSDARHISGLDSIPAVSHQWEPGPVSVLTVCNAYAAAAELRYFPRWEQNAENLEVA